VGSGDHLAPLFRVELFRQGGGADDVGEEDGNQLALAFGLQGGAAHLGLQVGGGGLLQGGQLGLGRAGFAGWGGDRRAALLAEFSFWL